MDSKIYDLELRTEKFAQDVRKFERIIWNDIFIRDDLKQLLRSSGSIAANYIEANEALSKRDFIYRIKICRKEAKESILWLKLIVILKNKNNELTKDILKDEATQLMKIFGKIVETSTNKSK